MVKKRCCGHHCPVCGGSALPLQGFSEWRDGGRIEGDVPWRIKLGRVAYKCQNGKHRFDIDTNTNRPFPDYLYKIESGGPIQSAPAGAPRG